jgi:putative phosphoesterase
MRIAAISDIHGNVAALEAVLDDIQRYGVDYLVCLGDLVALGPHPSRVIERIDRLGCPVVQGNTDSWFKDPLPEDWKPGSTRQILIYNCYTWLKEQLTPEEHGYLLDLPFQHHMGPALCVHGSPRDASESILPDTPEEELAAMVADVPPGIEVVLCGHTHHPTLRRVEGVPDTPRGGLTVVNCGSVAMSTDGDARPCYALLQHNADGWQVLWRRPEYDVKAAIAEARQAGLPHVEAITEAWRSGRGLGS